MVNRFWRRGICGLLGEEGSRVVGYWDLAIVANVGKSGSTTDVIVVRAGEGLLVVVVVVEVVEEGLLVLIGDVVIIELLEKGAVGIGWGVVMPKLGFDRDDVFVKWVDEVDGVVFYGGMVCKVDILGRGGAGSRGIRVGGVRVEVEGGHWREGHLRGDGFEQNNCLIRTGPPFPGPLPPCPP